MSKEQDSVKMQPSASFPSFALRLIMNLALWTRICVARDAGASSYILLKVMKPGHTEETHTVSKM